MTIFGSLGKFVHELLFPSYRVAFSARHGWHIVNRAGKLVEDGFVSEDAAKRRIPELPEAP